MTKDVSLGVTPSLRWHCQDSSSPVSRDNAEFMGYYGLWMVCINRARCYHKELLTNQDVVLIFSVFVLTHFLLTHFFCKGEQACAQSAWS